MTSPDLTPRGDGPVLLVAELRVCAASGLSIVEEVTFSVRQGEIFGIVGESGSGKTTTAHALLAHARRGCRIAGGSVQLEGQEISRLPARDLRDLRGRRVSYVPQDPVAAFDPRVRIGQQVEEAFLAHATDRAEASRRARQLFERVGLPANASFRRRYPFELSGGQVQRAAIAVAMIAKPAVVVLDEPTTGLDVTMQARVLELIRELKESERTAFVYVTHDLAIIDQIADRVAVMYAGRIVEMDDVRAVFDTPRHPYTRALLDAVPRFAERVLPKGFGGSAPPPGARPSGCHFAPRCPRVQNHCRQQFPPNILDRDERRALRCWYPLPAPVWAVSPGRSEAHREESADLEIVARNLTASFGAGHSRHVVVRDVSFAIPARGCLALVGESGSGKTTIARCLAGLHPPDAGEILLAGRRLARRVRERTPEQRLGIQLVYQNPDRSLNPRRTVEQALRDPLRLRRRVTGASAVLSPAELLERVQLPAGLLERYPAELSGGEKQRVALARALAAGPRLLICDEITSALDVSIQAAIIDLLQELRSTGLSILFITHDLALVGSIADTVTVLSNGQTREQGPTDAVLRRPRDVYTQTLIASVPGRTREAQAHG